MHGAVSPLPHVLLPVRARLQHVPHVRPLWNRALLTGHLHFRCLLRILVSFCKFLNFTLWLLLVKRVLCAAPYCNLWDRALLHCRVKVMFVSDTRELAIWDSRLMDKRTCLIYYLCTYICSLYFLYIVQG